ncbi:MAG: adenylosuccinate synthetase, partial [Flavobacteriales bacterium]|nr:adenylosuccinate synthetase [Flavobacteriales bacterium]
LLKNMHFIDSEHYLAKARKEGKKVLAEGAQGSLLDIDFGTYPFVTSSNTVAAGACTGLGIAPNKIGDVFGVFKAYLTRVGSGPFPTELFDETGAAIQKAGNEFGATTGRPRRCGWIDLPALKYAINVNGVTKLMMMKADVLSNLPTIKVCTHYKYNGEIIDHLPYNIEGHKIKPIYKELPCWKEDLTGLTDMSGLPKELIDYVTYLEKELETPITIVSVGPDRTQTIHNN